MVLQALSYGAPYGATIWGPEGARGLSPEPRRRAGCAGGLLGFWLVEHHGPPHAPAIEPNQIKMKQNPTEIKSKSNQIKSKSNRIKIESNKNPYAVL